MKEGREIFIQRINRIKDDREFYIDLRLIPFSGKIAGDFSRDTSRALGCWSNPLFSKGMRSLLNQKLENRARHWRNSPIWMN